jgi:hypothetical protein
VEGTLLDHEIIEGLYNSREQDIDKEHLVIGWLLVLLVGNMVEEKKRCKVVAEDWQQRIVRREGFSDKSEREKLKGGAMSEGNEGDV